MSVQEEVEGVSRREKKRLRASGRRLQYIYIKFHLRSISLLQPCFIWSQEVHTHQIYMSHVMCHLSPTPTPTATATAPANSPAMHSRLVHQDRTQKDQKIQNSKNSPSLPKKRGLNFAILAIRRSLQLSWFRLPTEGTDKLNIHNPRTLQTLG